MRSEKSSIEQLVERLENLNKELANAGVPPEKIDQIASKLEEYLELRDDIVQNRPLQFRDDAFEIAGKMSAASNKNIAFLAGELRMFAEHVVRHALPGGNPATVVSTVDRIPPLHAQEEE